MKIELDVQNVSGSDAVPGCEDFLRWVTPPLHDQDQISLSIRIVDSEEMQSLNAQYRNKDRPTNVLSFPAEIPEPIIEQIDSLPLGDIVICAPVMQAEATEQGKLPEHHWAHLTIHGVLHLLGHDHQDNDEAEAMESLERAYLSSLGISDPYAN